MRTQTRNIETPGFWSAPDDLDLELHWTLRDGGGFTLTEKERAKLLGEFVASEEAAPYSPEFQVEYSEWFTGVAEAAEACRAVNEAIANDYPDEYVLVGRFLCERTVSPLDYEPGDVGAR